MKNFKFFLLALILAPVIYYLTLKLVPYTHNSVSLFSIECAPDSIYYQEINTRLFEDVKNETILYLTHLNASNSNIGSVRVDLLNSTMLSVNYQADTKKNLIILIDGYEDFISNFSLRYKKYLMLPTNQLEDKYKYKKLFNNINNLTYYKFEYACNLVKKNSSNNMLVSMNREFLWLYISFIFFGIIIFFKIIFKRISEDI